MEPYARALIRFVHAAVAGRQKVEAFALGTRLTRITRELSSRDPDQALRRRRRSSGRLRRRYTARRRAAHVQRRVGAARHGARGDRRDPVRRLGPRRPGRARPSRCSGCTASPTRWCGSIRSRSRRATRRWHAGMAAALPHIDAFVEGHSIDAMEELARVDQRVTTRRVGRCPTGATYIGEPWSTSRSDTARSTRRCGVPGWWRPTRSA